MVLFEKYGQHQPLNRQSQRYAREGVELSLSILADQVGACTTVLKPLDEALRAHVFAAARIHGDDTPVPVLAPGKTRTGRLWSYVRDDRPFAGPAPPAAVFFYSPDRRGEHAERHLAGFRGTLQADAYAGFNRLYDGARRPGPVTEAACWAHGRRNFFELADPTLRKRSLLSPIALQAVQRIDAVFAIEREINGQPAEARLAVRQQRVLPMLNELEAWMQVERARLSRHADVAKAFDYMLTRWPAFTIFLRDGRICLTNNAAERALRGIALGRKAWLFAGSDRGGERAAVVYSLIAAAKLNDVDPQAWLADVLARIADQPIRRLDELLPWHWRKTSTSHDSRLRKHRPDAPKPRLDRRRRAR
jgi:transposase